MTEQMDKDYKFELLRARMIATGLFDETEKGFKITAKGKIVAQKQWTALDDGDKLLYTWLLRSLFEAGAL